MSRVLVYDVAASTGGALTILEDAYEECLKDKENQYVFVVSTANLSSSSNITVLSYPWIKKSWLHRLAFDWIYARKIVASSGVDRILSLQNNIVPGVASPQSVYLHNALPKFLTDERFTFRQSQLLWVYQNMIGKIIERSLKQCDEIITQTYWMKRRCVDHLKIPEEKIRVVPPSFRVASCQGSFSPAEPPKLFYPASSQLFKNHEVLFEACSLARKKSKVDFELIVTLDEHEDDRSRILHQYAQEIGCPVKFAGWMPKDELAFWYRSSILVFPSYLESWGLPLVEARVFNAPIIAADCEYAHETLGAYPRAVFFNPHDSQSLSTLINEVINRVSNNSCESSIAEGGPMDAWPA